MSKNWKHRIALTNDTPPEKQIISPEYHACVSISDKERKEDWKKITSANFQLCKHSEQALFARPYR